MADKLTNDIYSAQHGRQTYHWRLLRPTSFKLINIVKQKSLYRTQTHLPSAWSYLKHSLLPTSDQRVDLKSSKTFYFLNISFKMSLFSFMLTSLVSTPAIKLLLSSKTLFFLDLCLSTFFLHSFRKKYILTQKLELKFQ